MDHLTGMPFDRRQAPRAGRRLFGHVARALLWVFGIVALAGSGCAVGVTTTQPEPALPMTKALPDVVPQVPVRQAGEEVVFPPQEPPQPTPFSLVPTEEMLEVDAPTMVPPVEPAAPIAYTVQAGDTLLGIAMEFDVPMAAVQLLNDLGDVTTVRLGQMLEIPAAELWKEASPFWIVHVVSSGETVSEIAARYGLTLAELLSANDVLNADLLAVGQMLVLPIRAPADLIAGASEPPEAPQPSPTPTAEPVVVAAAVAVLPEAEPSPAEELPAVAAPAPPADVAALPGEVYRLINEQRGAYGLPPLGWNATLASAAQRHADDCYARGWCGHTGSDGSSYKERIIREGYDPVRWSECWAWYGSAERAVAMWMDEVPPNDPHRRTILSDYLTEVGVGVVSGNGYGYYFIADFGTPR